MPRPTSLLIVALAVALPTAARAQRAVRWTSDSIDAVATHMQTEPIDVQAGERARLLRMLTRP
jgi:hypothetical protein